MPLPASSRLLPICVKSLAGVPAYVIDFIGGGGQDRTADLWVMNPSL
jgi:hypothetical protein